MTLLIRPLAILAIAVATVGPRLTGQARPDTSDVYTVDLDSPGGRYSFWTLHTLRHTSLEARVVVLELRTDGQWLPGFNLRLERPGEAVQLTMWAPRRKSPLSVRLERWRGEVSTDSVAFTHTVKDTFHIELDWSQAGILRAVVNGNETRTMPLDFRPTSFQVVGSTGEFKLDPLILRRQRESR